MNWRLPGFRHICRSLIQYWGVSLLNISGLAIAFAATFIIALYVRDELTYDRFLPDADRTYFLMATYGAPGKPLVASDKTPAGMARWLRTEAAVEATARLHDAQATLRSDKREVLEHFYWADKNIFKVLRLTAVHGDLDTALSDYNAVVLTQNVARRYFGRDDVVGQTLLMNGRDLLKVTAVLADLPANTHLNHQIFVSSSGGYSMLVTLDYNPDWLWDSSYTYVRLKQRRTVAPGELKNLALRNWVGEFSPPAELALVPVTKLHFQRQADNQMKPRGHMDTVVGMVIVAGLILTLACVNVAGLMSAQIDERMGEMAVRKALGAQQHHLLLQILGEAALTSLLALIAGLTLAERLLPYVNAQLDLNLGLWSSPALLAVVAGAVVVIATLSTLGTGIRLSVAARQDGHRRTTGPWSHLGRIGWVSVQACLLITLLVSAHTVQRQWRFAMDDALNFNSERVVLLSLRNLPIDKTRFKSRILGLSGIEGAAYSRFVPIYRNIRPGWLTAPSGQVIQFTRESVDTDFFRFYGVQVLAGRGLSHLYDAARPPEEVVINTAAVKAFGYNNPQDAIGNSITYTADSRTMTSVIVGVVSDMRTATVREPLSPMVFDGESTFFTVLSVRVSDTNESDILAAVDRIWREAAPNTGPAEWQYFSDYLQDQYHDMLQQWRVFGLLATVGICLNVLGLSGLSLYLGRARMREVAIRNALGARLPDILRLRVQPFVKPLIVANLSAALISWLLMSWWLNAFKARVDLDPLSFLGAGALTIVITLLTLITHVALSPPARSSQPLRSD